MTPFQVLAYLNAARAVAREAGVSVHDLLNAPPCGGDFRDAVALRLAGWGALPPELRRHPELRQAVAELADRGATAKAWKGRKQ